jgi:hypothetical protein
MARKGFIHIVEIIIISLVMFLIVTQFANIPKIKSDWDRAGLVLQGNDLLFSLDEKGVDWLDSSEVESSLEEFLNETTIQYSLKIRYQNGTEYGVVSGRIERPVTVSYYKPVNGQFQVIEIILSLGHLY